MQIVIYPLILEKLKNKHDVSADEVEQAFLNRTGSLAKEVRPRHLGTTDRFWFISPSNKGRELKGVYFFDANENKPVVITAYEPNDDEVNLYEKIQWQKKK